MFNENQTKKEVNVLYKFTDDNLFVYQDILN